MTYPNGIFLGFLLFSIASVLHAEHFHDLYPDFMPNGQLIERNSYKEHRLEPYYPDSEIFYFDDSEKFFEVKILPLDKIMIRDMETNIANFGLGDLEVNFPEKSWQVACTKDGMTDKVTCLLSNDTLTIMHADGRQMMSSVKDDRKLNFYKDQFVRVDQNTAIKKKGIFENSQYNQIFTEIKIGKEIRTRYYNINGAEINNQSSLVGFKDAYSYMTNLKNKLTR